MSHASSHADEPSAALAGRGLANGIRRAFLATRPAFLIASALPVLVGTAWAYSAFHSFDALLFFIALAATILAHAAANVYNDVGDDVNGSDLGNADRIYPYTGGSRFIQAGLLSRREMTHLAIGLCVGALVFGIALALLRGPGVILLGAVGLLLGLLYSLPGAQLSARGVGEASVALGLGVLPVVGAVWLQTGVVDSGAWLLCVPVSCWITAILIINEVPDIEADRRANKRTLVVRWGASGARLIYRGLTLIALAAIGIAVARYILPLWFVLPALLLTTVSFVAAQRISTVRHDRPGLKRGIEMTLGVQAVGCAVLIGALVLEKFT